MTFLPVAVVVAVGRHFSVPKRVTAAMIAVLMLSAIVFTKSRGGALGLLVMVVSLVFLGRKVRPGFAAMAICAVLVAIPFLPTSFWNRMESIVNEDLDREQFTGSREARRIVMQEGIDAFLEYPLTGVGAGQFKNYNPPQRKERWRETHNALIQVASETGVVGLLAFCFLIVRGGIAAAAARRLLARPKKNASDPLRLVMSNADRQRLYSHTVAMTAGLVGWSVCALFASVAYNWTFYYLLALIVAARELARDRLAAGRAIELQAKGISIPSAMFSRRVARGAA